MFLADISVWAWVNIILILLVAYLLGMQLYTYISGKRVSTMLDNEEFKKGMKKAQVIDLREPDTFNAGHILGARNMPYSQFKIYKSSLRKDMPVYLYETGRTIATRAAVQLYKEGFRDLYILKSGYDRWDGKKKKSKY